MSVKIKSIFRTTLLLCLLLVCGQVSAQTTAKGTVTDATGEPVIGATVVEKGNAKNAAVTDFDGNFTLKLQKSKTVVISYIGMVTQEVTASENMKVTLQDDNASLDEVVVVGYTSKARKDLTGSVGSVSGAKLAVVPVSSAAEALTGKIAGVQVTTTDGQPGADINIRVRGATSVTQSNDPLYIVDGFQVPNINDIPPSDIASIDVLKDASLTAIYGAKGGNGVVIVTTKSAQAGKVQVTFNGRLSVSSLTRSLKLMNTGQFVDLMYDRASSNGGGARDSWQKAFRYDFGNPKDNDIYYTRTTNDWQDEILGNHPLSYLANVTVGGGNESTRFNLSLTQSEDLGIILGSGVRRTNINFKLNTKITKNLELTYNPKFTYRRDEGAGGANVGSGGLVDRVLRYQPTAGLREWGSYSIMETAADAERFNLTNPVTDIATNTQYKHSYTISQQAALKWTPIKGLVLRSEANYNISFRDTQRYWGWLTSEGQKAVHQQKPVAALTNRTVESYTWTNTASYDMTLKDVHNFSFLLGQEIYHTQYKENKQTAHLFNKDIPAEVALNNMALGQPYAQDTYTLRSTSNRTASFFGQVSYNWDHRYLLSATFRADGSSKFAPGHQWGYFPSVSGAWVINKEKFLKDVKWIDQLKLRAAFGLAGNNNINDDLWRFLYVTNNSGGPEFASTTTENGELYYGIPGSYPNKDIKWETTITRNLALDISLFGGRLSITPEFYWNTTRDLLYSSYIPSVSGYTRQMQNIGKVQNNGWELTINGDIIRGKDFVLSANFNLGHNKMTIKELNATDSRIFNKAGVWSSSDQNDYVLEVGGELGLMYGFVYDGLYSWDEFTYPTTSTYAATVKGKGTVNGIHVGGTITDGYEGNSGNGVLAGSHSGYSTMPGKIRIKDLNGDGQIDVNDKTVIGRTTPKWQGGFGISGQWKGFDFVANFTYMLDFDVYNATAYALSSSSSNQNTFWNVYASYDQNRWRYSAPAGFNDLSGHNITGESLYKNGNLDGMPGLYKDMNANVNKWNPADVVTNIMLDAFVEDGSFIRCSDVTIGYTLPKSITSKIYLNKVRAYVSASNLFILTKYSGYDPEVDVQSGLTPSMDYNRYPRARTFSFGLNVTF
ncbi:MAG: TonB-dependent receptor [Prevotella sp.]|nr:TonB-dependent receptor [Prevotella sp.]